MLQGLNQLDNTVRHFMYGTWKGGGKRGGDMGRGEGRGGKQILREIKPIRPADEPDCYSLLFGKRDMKAEVG